MVDGSEAFTHCVPVTLCCVDVLSILCVCYRCGWCVHDGVSCSGLWKLSSWSDGGGPGGWRWCVPARRVFARDEVVGPSTSTIIHYCVHRYMIRGTHGSDRHGVLVNHFKLRIHRWCGPNHGENNVVCCPHKYLIWAMWIGHFCSMSLYMYTARSSPNEQVHKEGME